MEAVAMSPSSVSSHNLDAASTSNDMPSSQEGLLFSDSLKDLRNLRSQLYSAAEYFEVFYTNNSHRSTVVTSLKDYAVEALVSTVDHLGFVSYKVDNLVNEKADEVNETEFRVSSVEQIIVVPLYRRRYSGICYPSGFRAHTVQQATYGSQNAQVSVWSVRSQSPTVRETHHRSRSMSPSRKARAKSPSPQVVNLNPKGIIVILILHLNGQALLSLNVQLAEENLSGHCFTETRAGSPIPTAPNPLARSATVARRPPLDPKHFRQTSMQVQSDYENQKEREKRSSKGRGFLKSLLTRRRWRNDESLYNYLDEY
uniref:Protein ABIL3 n=1 Tax=Aegilops tauschii TaxID=37682 RepID=M8CNR8_AEGTA